jgi:hypothetical protein
MKLGLELNLKMRNHASLDFLVVLLRLICLCFHVIPHRGQIGDASSILLSIVTSFTGTKKTMSLLLQLPALYFHSNGNYRHCHGTSASGAAWWFHWLHIPLQN